MKGIIMEHTGNFPGKAATRLAGGVEPHVTLVEGDDYSGLYDLDRIVAEMDAFYADAA